MKELDDPKDALDREYCFCESCMDEIKKIGYFAQRTSSLNNYIQDKPNSKTPIDFTQVKTMRDCLLILKPFIQELNQTLQAIEPLEG